MDAVKFVDAYIRMCSQGLDCEDCPLYQSDEIDFCTAVPQKRSREGAEKVVQIVEQWAKEHPVKTRQSEFLKLFPNAKKEANRDILLICPQSLDNGFRCPSLDCYECRRKYWGGEETK